MDNKINNDEIDILELTKGLIAFVKRFYKVLLGSVLAGICIGSSIYFFTPPYYESQIGFYSENLTDRKLYSLMLDLEKFLNSGDIKVLSNKMNISEMSVRKIKKMKVSAVEEEIGEVNSSDVKDNGILVTFIVKDNNLFDSLEMGLKYYIEQTTFVRTRLNLHRNSLIYNRDKLDKEIRDLDSMKVRLTNTITKGGKSNLFISDVGNIGSKLVEFYEKRSNLTSEIELVSDIRVFKSFSKYNKKAGPKFYYYFSYSLLISGLVGVFMCFLPGIIGFVKKA